MRIAYAPGGRRRNGHPVSGEHRRDADCFARGWSIDLEPLAYPTLDDQDGAARAQDADDPQAGVDHAVADL